MEKSCCLCAHCNTYEFEFLNGNPVDIVSLVMEKLLIGLVLFNFIDIEATTESSESMY